MKSIGLLLFTLVTLVGGLNDIATINRLKQEAEAALQQKEYQQAANYYSQLVDSLSVDDEAIRLNLAHALLMAGDTATAQRNYGLLTSSKDRSLRSVAYQQIGVVASNQKKYKEALAVFKESLKANPANEEARYDYELVKKLLEQQQNQEEQQQGKDQNEQQEDQKKDQQQEGEQQEQEQNQEGEQSEEQEGQQQEQQSGEQESPEPNEQDAQEGEQSEGEKNEEEQPASPTAEKLKEMNISEEKARMILEAMRNNEMQYIQQNRRKPQKPRDRTKPDW